MRQVWRARRFDPRLLATSSVTALLVAGCAPAWAACTAVPSGGYTGPYPVSGLCVTGNIGTGNITVGATGTITTSGIAFTNGTMAGRIADFGAITGGISLDGTSKITSATSGIVVSGGSGSNFAGGISNAGTIFAGGFAAVGVQFVTTFTGGITNSGKITAARSGIFISLSSVFAGGISNSGTIAAGGKGIDVLAVTSVAGGISNSGMISAKIGILVQSVANFGSSSAGGGISNSGTILSSSPSGGDIFVTSVTNFFGGITNSGTLSSALDPIAVASVTNFTGGISNSGMISAGAVGIVVQSDGNFSGGIGNSGTILSNADGIGITLDSIFSGGVSNSGTISAAQTGITVFGDSTFAGGITNTGTISAATGISVSGSGAVSVFDSGVIVGTGGTAVNLSGNAVGSSFTLGPGYNITGLVLGQNGDTFQLGGTGSGTFNLSLISTVIAGGCAGSACPQYEGFDNFSVVSGTWTTTGTFNGTQTWNVNGGTLAGTGTFAGINVNAGGTLEPGLIGQPGTFMTLTGNLAFQSGSIYLVNLSPTAASRANVSGAVTLSGAAVQGFLAPGSYSTKTTYDILDPSSISGRFSGFTAINAPGLGGTLTYNGNTDVLLNLTAQLGAAGGLNQNQQNVANTINAYFNNGGTLPAAFFPLFSRGGSALTQVDGEDATGAERGAFDLMNEFLGLMLDPFVGGRGGAGGGTGGALGFAPDQQGSLPPDIALAYAGLLKAPQAPTFQQRWSTWASGFGGSATTNGDPAVGSNNVTTSTYGYAAGMDYHYSPGTVFGFSLAGGGTNWNLANALGTGRSDALLAGVYGVTHNGPWYLGGALAFANNWFTTNRSALSDQITANFQGQSYSARLEGGYRFAVPSAHNAAGITPYAALQVQNFQTPAYSETDLTGGGLGLSFNAMNGTDTRSELGSRFDDLTALDNLPLVLRAKLAWAHDWVSNPALDASFQSLPGTAFTVNGAPIPHDSALTSAGAQLFFTPNWSFLAKFDGEFAAGYQLYAGTGTLRYTW
jgi:hypothetical protein